LVALVLTSAITFRWLILGNTTPDLDQRFLFLIFMGLVLCGLVSWAAGAVSGSTPPEPAPVKPSGDPEDRDE
jgi:hypothetical protein